MAETINEGPKIRWSEAAEQIAQELIPLHHRDISEAKIAFLFTSAQMTKNGKRKWATVKRLTGPAQYLSGHDKKRNASGYDFVMTISEKAWDELAPAQRVALVDHELCHIRREDGQWKIGAHDLEEFACIIERHGLWQSDTREFVRRVQQLNLPLAANGTDEKGKGSKVVPMREAAATT